MATTACERTAWASDSAIYCQNAALSAGRRSARVVVSLDRAASSLSSALSADAPAAVQLHAPIPLTTRLRLRLTQLAGTANRPTLGGSAYPPLYVSTSNAGGGVDVSPSARFRFTAGEYTRWIAADTLLCRSSAGINAAVDRSLPAVQSLI